MHSEKVGYIGDTAVTWLKYSWDTTVVKKKKILN